MTETRYFLAHAKDAEADALASWAAAVQAGLASTHEPEGFSVLVVLARDDFTARAAAMGGWKPWTQDVAAGADWRGEPRYHGIIVPILSGANSALGKATCDLVAYALSAGRTVYGWVPPSDPLNLTEDAHGTFYPAFGLNRLPGDSWKAWGTLATNPVILP